MSEVTKRIEDRIESTKRLIAGAFALHDKAFYEQDLEYFEWLLQRQIAVEAGRGDAFDRQVSAKTILDAYQTYIANGGNASAWRNQNMARCAKLFRKTKKSNDEFDIAAQTSLIQLARLAGFEL